MNSIVALRCHDFPEVCADKVAILNCYNPGVRIFGLFGGEEQLAQPMRRALGEQIHHWYETGRAPEWNWQNGDLAVRAWYRDYGHKLAFDRLYLVEWDLLLLDSLESLYCHVPPEAVAVTARFGLSDVSHDWGWMTDDFSRRQWERLLAGVREEYGYRGEPFASLGPGTCYSVAFLKKYSDAKVEEITCDEQRVPLYAQCFGIPVVDTKFRTSWSHATDSLFFNCDRHEVPISAIREELAKPNGRRAFHPFTQLLSPRKQGRPDFATASNLEGAMTGGAAMHADDGTEHRG
jgi:hypothetical protein